MTATADLRVLIVDDDPRNRKLLEKLLGADGYTVVSCDSGAGALQAATDLRPAAILLDIMMPGMDGFELVRRLKADPRTRSVPLVAITALDDEASRRRLVGAGIDSVLGKPLDRWQLKACLAALLSAEGGEHE